MIPSRPPRPRRRMTQAQFRARYARIIELMREGFTIREIAQRTALSEQRIYVIIKRCGLARTWGYTAPSPAKRSEPHPDASLREEPDDDAS